MCQYSVHNPNLREAPSCKGKLSFMHGLVTMWVFSHRYNRTLHKQHAGSNKGSVGVRVLSQASWVQVPSAQLVHFFGITFSFPLGRLCKLTLFGTILGGMPVGCSTTFSTFLIDFPPFIDFFIPPFLLTFLGCILSSSLGTSSSLGACTSAVLCYHPLGCLVVWEHAPLTVLCYHPLGCLVVWGHAPPPW